MSRPSCCFGGGKTSILSLETREFEQRGNENGISPEKRVRESSEHHGILVMQMRENDSALRVQVDHGFSKHAKDLRVL